MRKPTGIRFSRPLFYLLTAFMLAVMIISFVGASGWINKSFPGFLVYEFPFTGSYSMKDWSGREKGIKPFQRIVSINEHPVWHQKDVMDAVRHQEPGTTVTYAIESGGEVSDFKVPVEVFSLRDFLLVFLMTYIGGVAVFGLGFAVFFLKPDVSTSWVFFLYCLFLSLYMITAFEIQSTYMLVEFHYLALCLMPACLFHLCLIFPERKRLLARWPLAEYLVYLPALIFTMGYETYIFHFVEILRSNALPWLPSYKKMAAVNRWFGLFCVISAIGFVVHSMVRANAIQARQRARMILFGVTIAFAPPILIMMLGVVFNFTFPWNFLVFFVIVFPAAVAYSITRHNLFEADAIIRRTVGYAVVTAIIVGAYSGTSAGLNLLMGKYEVGHSQAFPILFTLGFILIFNPLRARVQRVVDRIFFRAEYDRGAIVERVGRAITSLMEFGQILQRLTLTFVDDMFVSTSSIMLLNTAGTGYLVQQADGDAGQQISGLKIDAHHPLMEIIGRQKKALTKYDVMEDPKYRDVSRSCIDDFDSLHANIVFPLLFQDQLIGIITLGEKKSGKVFNHDDVELLSTLAHQGAVAIENARLFKENLEKQRMEEELNIARDLQMSMLPARCPEIEGFQIVASSIPAREVGGDFYDFFAMGSDRVGMIVGDVTGKSVSGALVMSAARSVFRMLSEESIAVDETMMRANHRTKNDIKSGMFVALLYAVLNSKELTVRLCSAGQTQPILRSRQTDQALMIETEGDTFPLGILAEADYRETQIRISPGDMLVFYTDGIVEAMNPEKAMFGFDRLLDVIRQSDTSDAEALLKQILEKVAQFTGDAPQHDDLTLIVVAVKA